MRMFPKKKGGVYAAFLFNVKHSDLLLERHESVSLEAAEPVGVDVEIENRICRKLVCFLNFRFFLLYGRLSFFFRCRDAVLAQDVRVHRAAGRTSRTVFLCIYELDFTVVKTRLAEFDH